MIIKENFHLLNEDQREWVLSEEFQILDDALSDLFGKKNVKITVGPSLTFDGINVEFRVINVYISQVISFLDPRPLYFRYLYSLVVDKVGKLYYNNTKKLYKKSEDENK